MSAFPRGKSAPTRERGRRVVRALLCSRPGELALVERAKPGVEPGAALVRVRRAGVCGTDLHIFEGSQPYFEYPRVVGHELPGEIEVVGQGSRFRVGQRVAVLPYLSCGARVACRRGKPNCCQTLNVLGVHSDGGMADWLRVPDDNLVDAQGVSLDEAAMTEFLAIGADRVVEAGEGARAALDALTGGDFFDCVLDCTGSAEAMNAGFALGAHGGAYVLVSIVLGAISFADPEFHKRETTLLGSRNATRADFDVVLAALRAGKIPTKTLNTHRASLDDAPNVFAHWLRPSSGVVKAPIEI